MLNFDGGIADLMKVPGIEIRLDPCRPSDFGRANCGASPILWADQQFWLTSFSWPLTPFQAFANIIMFGNELFHEYSGVTKFAGF
ncbi:MAG TPA: hypothetical protein VG675_01190 [Bryobacteraceae bacterium]|nr:hypothetical protein [Bryobacteraceae bacterium]